MGKIINASSLDLSGKDLTKIPEYIFACKNLKSLNLSNNNLKEIPIELSFLKTLKKIDLSNNSITQVLSRTFELSGLEVLNLNNNKIKNLPKQLGKLKRLKSLHVSGNLLDSLPHEITELKELRTLNISNNRFTVFPLQLLELTELVRIWIGKNEFHSIPVTSILNNLQKLKAFYTFNPILKNYDVDRNTALLSKQKGNVLKDLKLMSYNTSETEIKNEAASMSHNDSKSIFISYNHADVAYKNEVEKTLKGLKHLMPDLKFDDWSDTRIRSGEMWKEEIEQALDDAGIAILIMSRNFLASEFIMTKELPVILNNAKKKGTIILTLVAGKCMSNELISQYQCVNDPNEPLKSLNEHQQDLIYIKLAEDVKFYLMGGK